jgi:cell division protein FtsQ
LIIFLIGLSLNGSWQAWKTGWVSNTLEEAKLSALKASAKIGFKLNDIFVTGRIETQQDVLLNAIKLARGESILAFDLKAAQKRVESLRWIKKATIKRMLPDTLLLEVEEHKPLALWQHKGSFSLIGRNGEVILQKDLKKFSDLMVVVGPDAPKHALSLLKVLSTEPSLMHLVKAAVRVGGRRWNLRLKGGTDVHLPEDDTASAWNRLAEYEKSHQILKREIKILDLRMPDRLIVRESPRSVLGDKSHGQET